MKHCMHVLHQTAQLPCFVCCVSLYNKLSLNCTCRSAGTWSWSILMMHAFTKALYASGEHHSPTCWPAVMPLPLDIPCTIRGSWLEAFARPAGTHNLHTSLSSLQLQFQSSSACMQGLSSAHCGQLAAHCGQLAV